MIFVSFYDSESFGNSFSSEFSKVLAALFLETYSFNVQFLIIRPQYLFTISHFVYADRPDFAHFKPIILAPTVPEDTTVYETYMLEKEGGYPGGVQQLKTDLEKHFASFTDDYEIRYFYEFVIEKNGSASHLKVLRGEVEAIHKHVKAFVENAQWTPGIYREKPVRSKLVVPVRLVR